MIAPDYPGFGFNEFPVPDHFDYTFRSIAVLINKFTEAIHLKRSGNIEKQFELNCDFKTHIEMFPAYQEYFRSNQPPALVLWGKYEIFFSVNEVPCYQRDLPNAAIHVLDGGHDVLDTHFEEVLPLIRNFVANAVVNR